jgi:hypothetical protein
MRRKERQARKRPLAFLDVVVLGYYELEKVTKREMSDRILYLVLPKLKKR